MSIDTLERNKNKILWVIITTTIIVNCILALQAVYDTLNGPSVWFEGENHYGDSWQLEYIVKAVFYCATSLILIYLASTVHTDRKFLGHQKQANDDNGNKVSL